MYDPSIGRWNGVDPIPKAHESLYAGIANNPINVIDVAGADTFRVNSDQNLNVTRGGRDALFIQTLENFEIGGNWSEMSADEKQEFLGHLNSAFGGRHEFSLNDGGNLNAYSEFDIAGTRDFLSTIAGESSTNFNEARGIGSVILNNASYMLNQSPLNLTTETLDAIEESMGPIYARSGSGPTDPYNQLSAMSNSNFFNLLNGNGAYSTRLRGGIQAIQDRYPANSAVDITGGARYWEGDVHYQEPGNYFRVSYNAISRFNRTHQYGNTHFFVLNPNYPGNPQSSVSDANMSYAAEIARQQRWINRFQNRGIRR